MDMFLEKYKPQAISGMIANRMAAVELKRAVADWRRGSAIVLSGPPGCGKTLAIEIVASEFGLEVAVGTADSLIAASKQSSIWSRGKMLVGDLDADVSPSEAFSLMKESSWPVVLVTTDIYQRSLAELRKDSRIRIITFQKAAPGDVAGLLKRACSAENIPCSERALYELALRSDGDVRWALVALESLKSADVNAVEELDRDRIERLFSVLDAVFQRRSSDFDMSETFAWVVENLPERYSGPDLARAYRCVASADRFLRVGMEQHAQEVMKLLPPSRISSQYRVPRWVNSSSIAEGVHCSARKAKAYARVMKRINSLQKKR